MATEPEVTLETVRLGAALAGLPLTEAEVEAMLPGVRRTKQMAAAVRALVEANDEPAGVFRPAQA
jgi:hypothetical protein